MADDQELDAYLDGLLGTEDGSEPEDVRDESEEPESEGVQERSFFDDEVQEEESDDEGEEDDEDPDSEYEDDGEVDDAGDEEEGGEEDDAPDQADARLSAGEARLKAIAEAVQRQQAEAARLLKHEQAVSKIKDIKANATDEEWRHFTNQFMKFVQNKEVKKVEDKLHKQQVVLAAYQANERMEREAAEYRAGQELAMLAAEEKLGRLSATERKLLETSTDQTFLDNYNFIVEARSKATEPAREALRTKRLQKGADRPPVRETGGARSVRKDYGNFSDIDAFFDDLVPDQVPRRA